MSCTAIQTKLSALRARRREQAELVDTMPHNAGYALAVETLAQIDADIASTQAELDLCLAQEAQAENPVAQNILGTVEKIQCHAASKELGDDEPYLLIASFDMTNSIILDLVGLVLPSINVVKIGPWSGVRPGETRNASELTAQNRPAFWNLSGQGSPITNPQDVIFLVACMENDGSSPDNIRGAVRTELLAARINNTNLAYSGYVTNMISNMTGAIETSRLIPGQPTLNFDDLFDDVKQLTLTTKDLADLNSLVPVTKALRFTVRKANGKAINDYTVTFSFTV
ncbi:MAG: hypothetical protein ABL919_01010 [Methylococcales bacterium]|nr:hypothetical protein [Methylococcaceae bacterium]